MKIQNIFGSLKNQLELNTLNIFNGIVTEQPDGIYFLMGKHKGGINVKPKDYYNLKLRENEVFKLIHEFLSGISKFKEIEELLILTNTDLHEANDTDEVFYLITILGILTDGEFISFDRLQHRFGFLIQVLYAIYLKSNDVVILQNLIGVFDDDFLLEVLNIIEEFANLFNCKIIILTNSMHYTNLIRNNFNCVKLYNLEYEIDNLNSIEITAEKYT